MKYGILGLLILVGCGQSPIEISSVAPKDGINGYNAMINIVNSAPSCTNGGITLITGQDIDYNGTLNSLDGNLLSATICNGANGANGQDGQDGVTPQYSPVSTIATCGNTVAYKEQLLCLFNGKILASFSDNISGYNTRLSFIPEGSYVNTDGSNCHFTISVLATGTLVSWSGGSALCPKN